MTDKLVDTLCTCRIALPGQSVPSYLSLWNKRRNGFFVVVYEGSVGKEMYDVMNSMINEELKD